MMRIRLMILLLTGMNQLGLSQASHSIYFVDTSHALIQDVILLSWKGATWLSDLEGKASIPEDQMDALYLHSMSFHDTLVSVHTGDTIVLIEESILLDEAAAYDQSGLTFLDHRKWRYQLQREPGEYYLLGYFAEGAVVLDSLTLRVEEILRSTSRIRLVIWKDGRFIFESPVIDFPIQYQDKVVTIPIDFHSIINGEFYVGIQFLEVGRDPFGQTSHLYQYRGKGDVLSSRNTGITVGSIRLKPGESMMLGWWYNGELEMKTKQATEDYRPIAPYFGIHYFGTGEVRRSF